MTKIEGLNENLSPQSEDWLSIQPPGQKTQKIRLENLLITSAPINHGHDISDIDGLETTLISKVDSATFTNTVSVLEQQIEGKSPVGHTHAISDVNGLLEKLSFQWTRKNSNGELIYKTLVDTLAGDVTLAVPSSLVPNQEFEVKKIFSNNYCKITGISKINGYSLQQGDVLFFDDSLTSASTTKLIYIDNTVGWLSFPSSAFSLIKPLSLPVNKLKQLFYTGNITGLVDGQTIQTWVDATSGLNANQVTSNLRPIYKQSIFGNDSIPGMLFSGTQILSFNASWASNTRFTYCIVERRNASGNFHPLTLSGSNGTFSVSYINADSSGFWTFLSDANNWIRTTVGVYSNPITRIWTISLNSRELSLWLNGAKMVIQSNRQPLPLANGFIGGTAGASGNYQGHLGMIAFYEGDMTDAEIKTISDAANQTFKVY